jgi:hypothetical protein
MLTQANSCICFHVSKHFNYNVFCTLSILLLLRKEMVDFYAAITFCFREHNFSDWKRTAVSLTKCNIFNMKDIFILLINDVTSCKDSCAAACICLSLCDGWACLSVHSLPNRDMRRHSKQHLVVPFLLTVALEIFLPWEQQHRIQFRTSMWSPKEVERILLC